MSIASYKALCIDALEVEVMAPFWGEVLGLKVHDEPTGARLVGEHPQQDVWVNRVPEPKSVKQRVHIDVNGTGIPEGATTVSAEGDFPWRVLQDPEGGELCLFTRDDPPAYRLYEVNVDSVDSAAQARWWAEVIGGHVAESGEGFHWVEEVPGMPFECLVFAPVPEPKTVKNRIHWDVTVPDASGVDDLVARGATVLRKPDAEISWTIMADPEGNEFCVFAS